MRSGLGRDFESPPALTESSKISGHKSKSVRKRWCSKANVSNISGPAHGRGIWLCRYARLPAFALLSGLRKHGASSGLSNLVINKGRHESAPHWADSAADNSENSVKLLILHKLWSANLQVRYPRSRYPISSACPVYSFLADSHLTPNQIICLSDSR